MTRKPAHKIILEMADDWEPIVRDAFLEAMQQVTDAVILADVIAAIEADDIERAIAAIGLNAAAIRPLTATIEQAFEAGGNAVGKTFPKRLRTREGVGVVFRFDVRDEAAENWLREKAARLVQTELEHVKVSIRNIVADGVTAGRNPRAIGLDITGRVNSKTGKREGGVIGLTRNQERWAAAVRRDLESLDARYFTRELRAGQYDDIVRDAIKSGKRLSNEQVNRLVGLYKNNALRYRGEVIGRNEALNGLRQSNRQAHQQVVDMGVVAKKSIKRIWNSAGDDGRTRPTHLEAERVTRAKPVGFDEPFTVGDSQMMFPGDDSLGAELDEIIQCRCIEEYIVDWTADLD